MENINKIIIDKLNDGIENSKVFDKEFVKVNHDVKALDKIEHVANNEENLYFWEKIIEILNNKYVNQGIRTLKINGILDLFIPEFAKLYGVPQSIEYHPEVDSGVHLEMCLQYCFDNKYSNSIKTAVFMHDLGKSLTPLDILPHHYLHEIKGLPSVHHYLNIFEINPYDSKLALKVTELHGRFHMLFEMGEKKVLKFFEENNLFSDNKLFEDFLSACLADNRGRLMKENEPDIHSEFSREIKETIEKIKLTEVEDIAKNYFDSYVEKSKNKKFEIKKNIIDFVEEIMYKTKVDIIKNIKKNKYNKNKISNKI